MAVFSDTTNKTGLVQKFEFWARLKDGSATGTLLKQVTDRLNTAFEKIMPLLLSHADYIRWDDKEYSDRPIGTIDIVSGQSDYTVKQDTNGLDILNINAVSILGSASATDYDTLELLTMDDERVLEAMSPSPSNSGVPSYYVENGNNIFLYPEPNYAATDGIKLFFQREHERFSPTGDDSKLSGIPKIFDELLVLHAVNDWVAVNRTDDPRLQNEIKMQIARMEKDLRKFIDMRNPTRTRIQPKPIYNYR